jgi:hypothetical protein
LGLAFATRFPFTAAVAVAALRSLETARLTTKSRRATIEL